ncbi:MAG: UDP-N-acetylglucosamine pyrophosphorylase [Clostridium butyricum]|nr:UDP-N-acetylglucosamine pyrophosphorylase [Clostridium butyricum]
MNLELTVYELGKLLKTIGEKGQLDILIKSNLSGGWMTITGPVSIVKVPSEAACKCGGGKDNIIDLSINNKDKESIPVKITGLNNKKFSVNIAPTKYKELMPNNLSLNLLKTNNNVTKLRIDENIIFTIKDSVENIEKLVQNKKHL